MKPERAQPLLPKTRIHSRMSPEPTGSSREQEQLLIISPPLKYLVTCGVAKNVEPHLKKSHGVL